MNGPNVTLGQPVVQGGDQCEDFNGRLCILGSGHTTRHLLVTKRHFFKMCVADLAAAFCRNINFLSQV